MRKRSATSPVFCTVWSKQTWRPTTAKGWLWRSAGVPSGASGLPTGPMATPGVYRTSTVAESLLLRPGTSTVAVLVNCCPSAASRPTIRKLRTSWAPGSRRAARIRTPCTAPLGAGPQVTPSLVYSRVPPLALALPGTNSRPRAICSVRRSVSTTSRAS